jgi:hypothetical protein
MHPNLRGFWRLENTLLDASGNGNNGTVGAGSAAYAAGELGRAWDNDATRFVDLGAAGKITGALTACAWVNPNVAANVAGKGIVGRYGSSGNFSWLLSYRVTGTMIVALSGDGTTTITAETSILPVGAWSHVAMTYAPASRIAVYLNGNLASEVTSGVPAALFDTSINTRIGAQIDDNVTRRFQGQIDEVQIYNAALDANDIRRVRMGQMPQRRYA